MKQVSMILPSGDIEQLEHCNRTTGRGLLLSLENKPSTFSLGTSACFLLAKRSVANDTNKWIEPSLPLSMYDLQSDVSIFVPLFTRIHNSKFFLKEYFNLW